MLPDIYDKWKVKARKTHKCIECHNIIEKKDEYYKISGLWDGSWSNFKHCIQCHNIQKNINVYFEFEYLLYSIKDELNKISDKEFVQKRTHWTKIYQEIKKYKVIPTIAKSINVIIKEKNKKFI